MTYAYAHNWIVWDDSGNPQVAYAPVYVNNMPERSMTEQTLALVLRAEMREENR